MTEVIKKQRLTDRKRAAILAGAVSEFQKKGFEGTSMDNIARAAGASKRTVYNHFPSKDALFAAIIDDLSSRFNSAKEVSYEPELELEPQLFAIGKAIVETTMGHDSLQLARVVFSRFLQSPEFAIETMKEQENFHQGLEDWIRNAAQDGRLKVGDIEHAATEFIGLIKTFVFWPQLIGSGTPLSKNKIKSVIQSSAKMFLSRYQVV